MSSLNTFQKYLEIEEIRAKIPMNATVSALLDYCEYAIHIEFNQAEKNKLKNKNRKKQLSEQFIAAIQSLSRDQKVEYYIRVVENLRAFNEGKFVAPQPINTGIINDTGFARSFNVKRWKEKKLRLDQDRQLLYAEREAKIKKYELKDYLLRKSKNKEYFCFVLEAINSNPQEKSRTVHIGFTDRNKFQLWFQSIKFSVELREWQLYLHLFKGTQNSKTIPGRRKSTDDMGYVRDNVSERNYSSVDSREDTTTEDNNSMSRSMLVSSVKEAEFMEQKKEEISRNQLIVQEIKEKQKLEEEIKKYQQKIERAPKTVVNGFIDDDFKEPQTFQDMIEDEGEASKMEKKHLDLFHKLYPEYELSELQIYTNFEAVYNENLFKIYQHSSIEKRLKMVVIFQKEKYSRQQILSLLAKPEGTLTINQNLQEVQIKTNIPSENSALVYQVLKPYNRLYRPRDFIFIRHVFNEGKKLYMIDKSIQNSNHPPFMTIVRGQLCIVYGIFDCEDHYQLIADFEITNQGYLNPVQETNLTMKFIKAFAKLPTVQPEINSYKFFDLDWDISKNQVNSISNEIRTRRNTINHLDRIIQQKEEIKPHEPLMNFAKKSFQVEGIVVKEERPINSHQNINSSPVIEVSPNNHNHKTPPTIKKNSNSLPNSPQKQKAEMLQFNKSTMEDVGQVTGQDLAKSKLQTHLAVIRQLDQKGYVVVNNGYRKNRFITEPLESVQPKWMEKVGDHPIWRGEWRHDKEYGGMIFINEKKIEDQKGVLKFVLTKIAKNLLSGQSILNISLPVDIFSPESNIQRFLYSMLYAPLIMDRLQKENLMTKLIRTIVFALSNSILYLSMEKPFNPILGQTFQCWINGCPAYAEQISHHPPIAAIMLKGRGYEVTAQLESKVSLALNSGTGSNEGIYRVSFSDNSVICFMSPGGEISGLTHGDRKFNLVGRAYFWISSANIVLQLVFNPYKKGLFSMGKQQQPSDYYEGTIWEVTPKFMAKFQTGKRKQPDQKDRLRDLGKVSGFWQRTVCFNGEEVFNFDQQYPFSLQYQSFPLPSDANWREDIEYRRRMETTRAQTEKERLEVLQRKDRKLRQKYRKGK